MKVKIEKPAQLRNASRSGFVSGEVKTSIQMNPTPEGMVVNSVVREGSKIIIEGEGRSKGDIKRFIKEGIGDSLDMRSIKWKL